MAASTASRLLNLFARREKTTVFYKDAQCTQAIARKPWYQSGHPRSNSKRVIINCYEFGLTWA